MKTTAPQTGAAATRTDREDPPQFTGSSPAPQAQHEDFASAAIAYARRGLRVFPLCPRGKRPLTDHGFLDATTDQLIVAGWWSRWPTANIGIATGAECGIWVLDIDGDTGEAALRTVIDGRAPLPSTTTSTTPRGGRHLIFAWPTTGPSIRNSASRIGRGIDVRGEGGYFVAPPSIGANGISYAWVENCARTIASAPAWLVTLTAPPPPRPSSPPPPCPNLDAYVAAAVNAELGRLEVAKQPHRNDTLNRVSFALGQLVKAGAIDEHWYRHALESRATAIGLPPAEVMKTINSAFTAAQPRVLPETRR